MGIRLGCVIVCIPFLSLLVSSCPDTGPAIISVSPGTLSRPEGTSAIFDCTASRPVTSFTWIYADSESGDLPAQTTVNMVSSTVSQLTVRFVGGSNTGTYRCTGTFPPRCVTATDVGILSIQGELALLITTCLYLDSLSCQNLMCIPCCSMHQDYVSHQLVCR